MKTTICIQKGRTQLIAHRGVSGLERENTNAAFVAACNRSYFGVETDVHKTTDGHYVILHDETTGRVAGTNINVEESTYAEVKGVLLKDMDDKTGRRDLVIPDLVDYLRLCKRYGKTGVLELKNEYPMKDIQEIVDIIRGEEVLDQIIFISFCLENLLRLRAILPDHPAQFLTGECTPDTIRTLEDNRLGLDIYYPSLTKELIDELHSHGIKVNCWTVDDPEAAARLIADGVDYITTDILE